MTAHRPRRGGALLALAWLAFCALSALVWLLYGPGAWALTTFTLAVVLVLLAKAEHDADERERAESRTAIRAAYLAGRSDRPEVSL